MSVPKNLHNKPCQFRSTDYWADDAIGDNFPLRLFCPNSKGLYLPSQ